jgi:hypothetical protein
MDKLGETRGGVSVHTHTQQLLHECGRCNQQSLILHGFKKRDGGYRSGRVLAWGQKNDHKMGVSDLGGGRGAYVSVSHPKQGGRSNQPPAVNVDLLIRV